MFIKKKNAKILDIKILEQIKNEIIKKVKCKKEDAYSRFEYLNREEFMNKEDL